MAVNPSEIGPSPQEGTEVRNQPKAPETPDELRERISSAVKNEVGKEAGIVDRLQQDPQDTAKVVELHLLQNPTSLAYMKTKPELNAGADEIQTAVKEQVQKTLLMAA